MATSHVDDQAITRTSAVTKMILYVALMVSLSPWTCVVSALEASVTAESLSASLLSLEDVAMPSKALDMNGFGAFCFCLNDNLLTGMERAYVAGIVSRDCYSAEQS